MKFCNLIGQLGALNPHLLITIFSTPLITCGDVIDVMMSSCQSKTVIVVTLLILCYKILYMVKVLDSVQ